MIKQSMTIFYVSDQKTSKSFYGKVFGLTPSLDVPGMSEFQLGDGMTFGLMPQSGIKNLLGKECFHDETPMSPQAELYILVDDAQVYLDRALNAGASPLLPLELRDWGHKVAYCLDPDAHVLAFAETEK